MRVVRRTVERSDNAQSCSDSVVRLLEGKDADIGRGKCDEELIAGVRRSEHLKFSRPGRDWMVWMMGEL
jgi:hypothetical protein